MIVHVIQQQGILGDWPPTGVGFVGEAAAKRYCVEEPERDPGEYSYVDVEVRDAGARTTVGAVLQWLRGRAEVEDERAERRGVHNTICADALRDAADALEEDGIS